MRHSFNRAHKVHRAPILALAVVLVAAACSSKSAGGTGGSLNVGVEGPLTGFSAAIGTGIQNGVELAKGEINANGGVLGHQIHTYIQDDSGDAVDAVPAAATLINVHHVVALMGPASYAVPTVLPMASKQNIPVMMFGGGASFDHSTNPHLFRMSPSDSEQGTAMVTYAHSRGWNQIALAFDTTGSGNALIPPIQSAATKLGMSIVASVTFVSGEPSYSSGIASLFAHHPQAVLSQMTTATAATVFKEVYSGGFGSTPWIGSNLWHDSSFFSAVGERVATGPLYITDPSNDTSVGAKAFTSLAKQKYGTGLLSVPSQELYDGFIAWALGADQAGTWKWPAVQKGIRAVCSNQGAPVGTYAEGYALLKQHKQIHYVGAASDCSFDDYQNVFGPFNVLQFKADRSAGIVATLSSQQLAP
jgi:ABC-type branched-subunit amino acid transport system substrate-binding protein